MFPPQKKKVQQIWKSPTFCWKPNTFHTTKTPRGRSQNVPPLCTRNGSKVKFGSNPTRKEVQDQVKPSNRCGKNTCVFFPLWFYRKICSMGWTTPRFGRLNVLFLLFGTSGNKSVNVCDSMFWKDANIVGIWSNYSDRKHDLGPQKGREILVVRYYILARWYVMVRFLLLLLGGWVVCFNILGPRER